jgi:hypothetical protein
MKRRAPGSWAGNIRMPPCSCGRRMACIFTVALRKWRCILCYLEARDAEREEAA